MADKTAIIKDAQRYLEKGQIDKAIAEWEKLLKEGPDVNIYNTIGDLYLKKGAKVPAVESFHKAATIFRKDGFTLKAIALYKKIINIEPKDIDSNVALGELSEEKGIITDAIRYYLTAADSLSKNTHKERYLSIYGRILSLEPFNIPLRDKIAGLFLKEGLKSEALREILYIARLSMDRGDLEAARDYFTRALETQPDNKAASLGLSNLYEQKGDIQQAISYTEKTLNLHPNDVGLLLRYASLLKKSEMYDDAITSLSRVLELKPSDTEACKLMGEIYLIREDRKGAWEYYKTVVDSFVRGNQIDDAIEIAKQFRDMDPVETGKLLISLYSANNDIDAVFKETLSVADLLLERSDKGEAMSYYRKAMKINPDDMQLKSKIAELELSIVMKPSLVEKEKTTEDMLIDAEIFIKYGLFDEARVILDELKSKEPQNIDVHLRLKSLYMETDDKEQAVTECLILSELYKRKDEIEKSEVFLKNALDINPYDPRLLERISAKQKELAEKPAAEEIVSRDLDKYAEDIAEAEFYIRQGLVREALNIYQRLSSLLPDNEEILMKISSLQEALSEAPFEEAKAPPQAETVETHKEIEPQFTTDVRDIFEEFKKGLETEVEVEDYETHYNLGMAYKEMGLTDDAIKEFQTSRKDPKYYLQSMSMLGICYMEKETFLLAIDAFKNALNSIDSRDESYWGTKYDLAVAYEKNGNIDEAFEIFTEIYGWDSKFRKVNEKIDLLKTILSGGKGTAKQKQKLS